MNKVPEVPNIGDLHHEEEVDEHLERSTSTLDWREGRRVVELGVLADALKACNRCGMPLQLFHAVEIKTYGLAAILKVDKGFFNKHIY